MRIGSNRGTEVGDATQFSSELELSPLSANLNLQRHPDSTRIKEFRPPTRLTNRKDVFMPASGQRILREFPTMRDLVIDAAYDEWHDLYEDGCRSEGTSEE